MPLCSKFASWHFADYDKTRDAILTCAQKLMEPTTKKWEKEELKSKNGVKSVLKLQKKLS